MEATKEGELLPDQEHLEGKDRRVRQILVVAEVAVEVVLTEMVQHRRGDSPMEVKFQGLSQTFSGGWWRIWRSAKGLYFSF